MEPFQQRVVDEKRDLDAKIIALCTFMHSDKYYSTVTHFTERCHLQIQFKAMMDYSHALAERIENFNQGN